MAVEKYTPNISVQGDMERMTTCQNLEICEEMLDQI